MNLTLLLLLLLFCFALWLGLYLIQQDWRKGYLRIAVFCDINGFVMVLAAKPISQLLGLNNPAILMGLGIGLIA